MPYDPQLAARIRALLAAEAGVTEQKMFGGLGFLVSGNMAVAASHTGGLLARVEPAQASALTADDAARPMEMRGRSMPGWLMVDAAALRDEAALEAWVTRCVAYARALPPK